MKRPRSRSRSRSRTRLKSKSSSRSGSEMSDGEMTSRSEMSRVSFDMTPSDVDEPVHGMSGFIKNIHILGSAVMYRHNNVMAH